MYQFSLQYFNDIFNNTISISEKADNLDKRLKILLVGFSVKIIVENWQFFLPDYIRLSYIGYSFLFLPLSLY